MNPLTLAMDTELHRASGAGMDIVFNGLAANLAAGDWLHADNPYRTNCTQQIKMDCDGPGVDSGALAEYIAASIPLHCLDGWTFLARALSSYINGNAHQAAHFAYYAELRAAMSILASQGIGVFNNIHFTVDATGACRRLTGKRPTHDFVWLALQHWANTPSSGAKLLELFVVSNSTVHEWFSALPGYNVAAFVATDWLRDWGLDLSTIDTDHDVRNLASYRPNSFYAWNTNARTCSEFLRSMWALFEPSNTRFEVLDGQLLRLLVRKVILDAGDPEYPNREALADQQLTTMLNNLPHGEAERRRLKAILASTDPEPMLLERAGPGSGPTAPDIHERVMARAALLLRVATGFTAQKIDTAAFNAGDLRFWTDACGERRAFWEPGGVRDELSDLWLDISGPVESEAQWFADRGATSVPMYEWRFGREQTLRPLAECDRVGLWGLQR